MDLLASYSDDGDSAKNTPTRTDQMLPKVEPTKSDACLEAEWESFEKMISGTESSDTLAPPPLPVGPPELSISSEQSFFSNMSEPPTLSNIKDQTQFFNHADPPTLTNSTEPVTHPDDEGTAAVKSPQNPSKLTDIILPSQYDDEMPILTKISGSPMSSDHSRSRSSSSSSSRSSSADSVRSEEERKKSLSPVSSKRESSPRKDSSTSKRKDEKRDKRSRSRHRSRSPHRSRSRSAHRSRSRSAHRSRSRSPHRKRRRSSDRKRSRSKSRGRRRSSERKRRSRSRGKRRHHSSSRSHRRRRSGSRSKRRQSREKRSSRDHRRRSSDHSHRRDRRDKSKERRRRSRSKERRRSRSRSPTTRGKKCITRAVGSKPLTFKEQMRQQLLKASKMLSEQGDGSEPKEIPIDKQNNMPLSASSVFSAVSAGGNVTPQMALLQTMAAMHQKAQEITGVAVPRFYNPAAVNPLKYAEQVQKRKLLWGKNKEKKEDEGQGQWQGTAFVSDSDGKMAAKFRKLMGMKEGAEKDSDEEKSEEQKKKTEEMFYRLDKEYEFARMTTHTHRGIGLGFQSQGLPNP